MDKTIVFPIQVSDRSWQQFIDQPSDYVDEGLRLAIKNNQREAFVRRAYEIRRARPMPKIKNLVWHLFLDRVSDRTKRIITPEQQEVTRLWWMRRSFDESCGFPPLHKKAIGRLRRMSTMLR